MRLTRIQGLAAWPLAALAAITATAWIYVVYMAHGMENMLCGTDMLFMPAMKGWGAGDLALILMMWTLMMAAMMLPSAASMLRAFVVVGGRIDPVRPSAHVIAFAMGYLGAWFVYSIFATLLQWLLLEARLVNASMEASSLWLGGSLLVLAGAYQFTSWKNQCLTGCRSPTTFLAQEWRSGTGGAARMGWRHGVYCVGCCWILMLLLFVLGVMNLAWNVALAALVVLEKHVPNERLFLRVSGCALIAWGLVLFASALRA